MRFFKENLNLKEMPLFACDEILSQLAKAVFS